MTSFTLPKCLFTNIKLQTLISQFLIAFVKKGYCTITKIVRPYEYKYESNEV